MQTDRRSLLARTLLTLIWLYRNLLSINMLHSCRFTPSCSSYATEAVKRYGALRGIWRAACRIVRCQPFSQGGFDQVS